MSREAATNHGKERAVEEYNRFLETLAGESAPIRSETSRAIWECAARQSVSADILPSSDELTVETMQCLHHYCGNKIDVFLMLEYAADGRIDRRNGLILFFRQVYDEKLIHTYRIEEAAGGFRITRSVGVVFPKELFLPESLDALYDAVAERLESINQQRALRMDVVTEAEAVYVLRMLGESFKLC